MVGRLDDDVAAVLDGRAQRPERIEVRIQPAATDVFERGEVYANFIATFSRAPVTAFYVLAMVLLGMHLYHGAWSMFQSLGINHPRFNTARRYFAVGLAVLVTVGNAIMPLSVLFGWVG